MSFPDFRERIVTFLISDFPTFILQMIFNYENTVEQEKIRFSMMKKLATLEEFTACIQGRTGVGPAQSV